MAEAGACPECGNTLPADAPEGLCPSCLLQSGLASDWLLSPRKSTMSPPPGPFIPPAPAELTRHFPQLDILTLLGQGGMGAVYLARQTKLDRLVALKVLPPNLVQDPAFAERFTREARALARLNHPNIVSVHDFGESGGLYYFIMEYVDGASLRQVLLEGRLSSAESLKIVPQLCDALQYAHDEGIIHRDIKPENILLDKKGRVKIADFGLAKLVGAAPANYTLTGSRQIMGTPHYMAPEQMEKPQTVDHRADIYSLGVVFYEMLTGELPLGRFAPPSHKAAVDGRLDEVVLRALAKEPQERYQKISDLKAEVEGAPPVAGPVAQRRTRRAVGVRFTLAEPRRGKALGMVRLEDAALVFEYELDYFGFYRTTPPEERAIDIGIAIMHGLRFGFCRTAVKEKRVPLAELVHFTLEKGWRSATLHISTSRFNTFDGLPCGRMGQIAVPIEKRELPHAEELAREVRARIGPSPEAPPLSDQERAEAWVARPAVALAITALVALLFWIMVGIGTIAENEPRFQYFGGPEVFWPMALFLGMAVLGLCALMAAGALNLRRCENAGPVIAAAIVAMLPWSVHFSVGLPIGIWVLARLRRPEVREAFLRKTRRRKEPLPPPEPRQPTGFVRRQARSVLRGFQTLFFDSYVAPEAEHGGMPTDPYQAVAAVEAPAAPPADLSNVSAPALPAVEEVAEYRPVTRRRRRRFFFLLALVVAVVVMGIIVVAAARSSSRRNLRILEASMPAAKPAAPEPVDPDQAIRAYLRPLRLDPRRQAEATNVIKGLLSRLSRPRRKEYRRERGCGRTSAGEDRDPPHGMAPAARRRVEPTERCPDCGAAGGGPELVQLA